MWQYAGVPSGFADILESMIEVNRTTKAEVARRLGVAPSTLTRWTNEPRNVSAQNLLALARILGVDPYVLMGTSFEEPGPAKEQPRRGRPPRAQALATALNVPARAVSLSAPKAPRPSPATSARVSRR